MYSLGNTVKIHPNKIEDGCKTWFKKKNSRTINIKSGNLCDMTDPITNTWIHLGLAPDITKNYEIINKGVIIYRYARKGVYKVRFKEKRTSKKIDLVLSDSDIILAHSSSKESIKASITLIDKLITKNKM